MSNSGFSCPDWLKAKFAAFPEHPHVKPVPVSEVPGNFSLCADKSSINYKERVYEKTVSIEDLQYTPISKEEADTLLAKRSEILSTLDKVEEEKRNLYNKEPTELLEAKKKEAEDLIAEQDKIDFILLKAKIIPEQSSPNLTLLRSMGARVRFPLLPAFAAGAVKTFLDQEVNNRYVEAFDWDWPEDHPLHG